MERQVKGRTAAKPFIRDHAPLAFGALVFVGALIALSPNGKAAQPTRTPSPQIKAERWSGSWPFREQEVTLSCKALGEEKLPAVFVTVDEDTYGLNGLATTIATSPRPILLAGIDTQPITARATALCGQRDAVVMLRHD